MPDLVGALAQRDPGGFLGRLTMVEEAEVHRGGVLGEDGEVGALAVPGGTERRR
jgi:hypothetical protein